MISEIKLATLGVSDLERSSAFYRSAFGWEEKGRGETGAALESAWRMPAGLRGRFAVLGPADKMTGLVRLVQWSAPGERIWGAYERRQDLGHYAVNVRVREIQAGWKRILAAGARPKSAPEHWVVDERTAAWDSQAYDPDGVLLDVFEVLGEVVKTLGEQKEEASEVQTVALHVSDMRCSRAFYQGLGFRLLYDKVIEGMGAFFGIAGDVKLHNVNLLGPGPSPNGRIELAQYVGFPGRPLQDRAVPPNLGILGVSMETDDLEAARDLVMRRGGAAIDGTAEADVPPFGRVRLATAFGPDGEGLELFQRI